MHITILALGSRGDVQPYANLGKGLQEAGHRVRFITFESFAPLIAQNGLDFHPIRGDAQALVARGGADMPALMRSFGSLAEGYARDLSAPHLGETDLILDQVPGGLYGFDLSEKYRVPLAVAAVMPLATTGEFPLFGFPKIPLPVYNRATYYVAHQMGWQMFRGVINRWRTKTLGLPPTPLRGYFVRYNRSPSLNGFSQHVVRRPADWGKQVHVTGYWFPSEQHWQPPAELSAFIEGGCPPVFIGFGSTPVRNARRTTQLILEALRQSGQRAVLQKGWGGLGEQELPENVFKIDTVPYGWLFPRMAMTIHHGGSGTTGFALRAGVPSCAVPFVFDQFYWGRRIAELGAGPRPIPHARLSAERLAEAICEGIGSASMRQKAVEIGEKIRSEDGIRAAAQVIDGLIKIERGG